MVGRISTYWNIIRRLRLVLKILKVFSLKISFLIQHQTFCPIYSLTLKYILYYPSQQKLISLKAVSLQSLPILSLECTIEISPCGYKIYYIYKGHIDISPAFDIFNVYDTSIWATTFCVTFKILVNTKRCTLGHADIP